MKKLSAYAIVIMIAVAVFVQSSKMNDREENELFLSNVEALALNEDDFGETICYGSGKVDCLGKEKVEYAWKGYGLNKND
ncbi:MAG: hypothetical protein IJB61_05860 [Bacteroides sp]|nr:hypothetical protein [Bacteroides sp.]